MSNAERWRGDAPHRLGPLHHRMATDHRHPAAPVGGGLAGGLRQIPADSPVPARQSRYEPGGIQVHLLVGMGASPARPTARPGVFRTARLFPRSRPDRALLLGLAMAIFGALISVALSLGEPRKVAMERRVAAGSAALIVGLVFLQI